MAQKMQPLQEAFMDYEKNRLVKKGGKPKAHLKVFFGAKTQRTN